MFSSMWRNFVDTQYITIHDITYSYDIRFVQADLNHQEMLTNYKLFTACDYVHVHSTIFMHLATFQYFHTFSSFTQINDINQIVI